MAEDTDNTDVTPSESDSGVTVKRRLRAAPETVRERSEKHRKVQDAANKPKRRGPLGSIWYGFTWPLRAIGHQVAKLSRFRVFRIIGLILFPRYFRNAYRELRLVTWPDRRQSWRLTYAVIVFSVLFGAIVYVVDLGLDKLFKEIILK